MTTRTPWTPGPWHVEADTCVHADNGDFIADTHEPISIVGTAREYANAQLIALAPEMAEALRAAHMLLSDYVNHEPIEMCAVAEHAEAIASILLRLPKVMV